MISPTRELAVQISTVVNKFLQHDELKHLRLIELIGGTELNNNEQEFIVKGGNIAVCTPGRLESTLKHLKQFDVKNLEVLILDEADR